MENEFITFVGQLLLRRSILVVVILGGLVFAVARWKRHPRVSFLTTVALGFYLVESWFFAFLFHYLPSLFETLKITGKNIGILDSVLQLLDDFAFAIVLALLVAAAFGQRRSNAAN